MTKRTVARVGVGRQTPPTVGHMAHRIAAVTYLRRAAGSGDALATAYAFKTIPGMGTHTYTDGEEETLCGLPLEDLVCSEFPHEDFEGLSEGLRCGACHVLISA